MKELSYNETFFDLKDCFFKELFLENEYVWDFLKNLKAYIDSVEKFTIKAEIHPLATLVNSSKIAIGENSTIHPGALIEGPCIIGKNVHIGHGAYLRPYSLIGDFCHVGHATEIKHSVLLSHAKAPHFNYIGDSLLGNHVNLGAGVVLANYKTNHKEVSVKYEGQKILTGLKKFGAIVGDYSFLGCNSVTNPGTLIAKRFSCTPCSNLQGFCEIKKEVGAL